MKKWGFLAFVGRTFVMTVILSRGLLQALFVAKSFLLIVTACEAGVTGPNL